MGSSGPIAKRTGRQRNQRPTGDARLARFLEPEDVEPSPRWLAPTREAWVDYLASPIVSVVDPIDVPALRRLFDAYDLYGRLWWRWMHLLDEEGDGALLGEGSGGQAVVHPLLASLRTVEQTMKELETRFGITPQSRARLGIDLGAAAAANEKARRMNRQDRGDEL